MPIKVFLNTLIVASFACGAICWCVVFYANAQMFASTSWLLRLLKDVAPDAHERLSDPSWRTGVAPWKLRTFLQSDELDEVGAVKRAKGMCRRYERLLLMSIYTWLALTCFCLAVGALAEFVTTHLRP